MRLRVRAVALAAAAVTVTAGCGSSPNAGETSSVVMSPASTAAETATSSTVTTPTTHTVSKAPTTIVTTPTDGTLVAPPPSTPEPPPSAAECPYLTTAEVSEANGQRVAKTETIATEPYPICLFYRPDGTVMAVTRIVQADTDAAATAAINQHVPIDESFPATHPSGWTGGAMSTPNGVPGYPDAGSIYAVSKGKIAVIAISNQKQSIKGRQMATLVVKNLGL